MTRTHSQEIGHVFSRVVFDQAEFDHPSLQLTEAVDTPEGLHVLFCEGDELVRSAFFALQLVQ